MTTQMPDIMPQRVLLGYVNEEADGGYNGKRCVGDRCYAEDYYNRIPRGRQITDESSDDWTFEFILSQIWRKYPYVLLSSVLTVLLLVITTVWLCGRHVSASPELSTSYAEFFRALFATQISRETAKCRMLAAQVAAPAAGPS